jgi:hypothetical protein
MTNRTFPEEPTMTDTSRGTQNVRSLLWVVLVISTAANGTTSTLGMNVFISIAFGLVTLATGVALVANYRRNR